MHNFNPLLKIFFSLCPFFCFGQLKPLKESSEEEILFFNRIADFWEEKEYEIARNQMEAFLALYPESPHSDLLAAALGSLSLREENPRQALEYYLKIKSPEVASAHFVHRVQCLYSLQWYSVLADECEAFLETSLQRTEESKQITSYLALALYHLCLDAEKKPDLLSPLFSRAKPYFETLLEEPENPEIASAFAHLCSLLKEFPKAAFLYRNFASEERREEMLFQSALAELEYDKEAAIRTFQEVIDLKGPQCKEAYYNLLVLSFELKKYALILSEREKFLTEIPEDRKVIAHLFFGKSFLALQNPIEACSEIQNYFALSDPSNIDLETYRLSLIAMLDASFQAKNLAYFSDALQKMETLFPLDEELLNGKFFKAVLLSQENRLEDAKQEFLKLMTHLDPLDHPLKPEILIELSKICALLEQWESCKNHAKFFLKSFQNHESASLMKEHLIAASMKLSQKDETKEDLISDLHALLSIEKRIHWQFLLAKTYISVKKYPEAVALLEEIPQNLLSPSENIECAYLLALCFREEPKDLVLFCKYAETALKLAKAEESLSDLIDLGSLHACLYNAYLQLSSMKEGEEKLSFLESAKTHLFEAFYQKTPIEIGSLLWLGGSYAKEEGKELQAISIFEHILSNQILEKPILSLSSLYLKTDQKEKSRHLLEGLMQKYETSPTFHWEHKNETAFALAELYANTQEKEKALSLFHSIAKDASYLKTEIEVLARLRSIRLQMEERESGILSKEDPQIQCALSQLKNLVLQKNIALEPLYFEAALDYIDIAYKCDGEIEKKIFLLEKTKRDFEYSEDLLSINYHEARKQFPIKNKIYESYIQFLEAEILRAKSLAQAPEEIQKQLQAKSKDLFLKIIEEKAHPSLVARANKCLYPE